MDWQTMMAQLKATAVADPRIVGLVDYGSSVEGRADKWSDVDVALFIQDETVPAFKKEWQTWAAQFGDLLLAYISGVGHPWCVYAADPLPLRVDFNFFPISEAPIIQTWAKSPTAVAAMVHYDPTGTLATQIEPMLGQSLAPQNPEMTFTTVCGDFWYYILRLIGKLQRNQAWAARWEFNFIVIGNLAALMRLESGQIARFRASQATDGIETAVSPRRRAQLNQLIPGPGLAELHRVLQTAVAIGIELCQSIQQQKGWSWPQKLAKTIQSSPLLQG